MINKIVSTTLDAFMGSMILQIPIELGKDRKRTERVGTMDRFKRQWALLANWKRSLFNFREQYE